LCRTHARDLASANQANLVGGYEEPWRARRSGCVPRSHVHLCATCDHLPRNYFVESSALIWRSQMRLISLFLTCRSHIWAGEGTLGFPGLRDFRE
jgi:hypothetical protein